MLGQILQKKNKNQIIKAAPLKSVHVALRHKSNHASLSTQFLLSQGFWLHAHKKLIRFLETTVPASALCEHQVVLLLLLPLAAVDWEPFNPPQLWLSPQSLLHNGRFIASNLSQWLIPVFHREYISAWHPAIFGICLFDWHASQLWHENAGIERTRATHRLQSLAVFVFGSHLKAPHFFNTLCNASERSIWQ